jgi:plastocyanin
LRRASFIAGLAATLWIGWAAPAPAGVPVNIDVYDWLFLPEDVEHSVLGTGVIWNWNGGSGTTSDEHNVREDSKLFRSPLKDEGSFQISPSAGTYHYYCEPHLDSNDMQGGLKITPAYTELSNPDELRIVWAQDNSDTGDRFDVRYRVGIGPFKTWKKDTAKLSGRFGRQDEPVAVKPGKTYSFKVRSGLASKPSKQSKYSPALVVDVPAR